jgi:hypothetical protein
VVDDELRDERAGVRVDRDVAVDPAEHDDLEARADPSSRRAAAPPDADRVHPREARVRRDDLFRDDRVEVRLPHALAAEDEDRRRDGGLGKLEVGRDPELRQSATRSFDSGFAESA